MRVSCNGCRILRKGCGDNCSIRPCLQWIRNPQSQSNATLFLAKFYGRAGLVNLINTGPEDLRPAIFKSLLYEACGRIVNPIHGSVGLMWSGSWQLCQAAVEAVLKGEPITPLSSESALKAGDIRHVSKDDSPAAASDRLHKVKSRSRFKRSAPKPKSKLESVEAKFGSLLGKFAGSTSHDPELSQRDSGEADSVSVETVEVSLAKLDGGEGSDVELELSLGLGKWLP